jgi:hypothetical protein
MPTAGSMAGTIRAFAPATLVRSHWLLGYPDKALAISREALALAERIAHPLSLESTMIFNAILHVDRGEPKQAYQSNPPTLYMDHCS